MSEFDKWWEENCMTLSSDRTEAEDIYNLGAESQQTKIDELQEQLRIEMERGTEYFTDFHSAIAERDELQARVERGLKIAEDLMGEMQNYKLGESLENILKGNKDEN